MTDDPILTPEALPGGADGVLLRFSLTPRPEAMAAVQVLLARLEADRPAGVEEIVPGLVSVLLRFDPARADRAELMKTGLGLAERIARDFPALPDPSRRWTIPAAFGGEAGPQLAEVARLAGLSESAAVAEICATPLRVLTIGFAPGLPYLGLLPERWNFPRQTELTPKVPAGAVVAAVRQIVLFGAPSTTGWRQVGRSGFRCFQPGRETPMPLRAGDEIRFAAADASEIGETADGLGGARLELLR